MSHLKKILCCIALLFSCVFVNVGYASLVRELQAGGNLEASPEEKSDLFISNSELISKTNITSYSYNHSNPTNFLTKVDILSNNVNITYKITVTNNSSVTYWYDGIKYVADIGSNNQIDKKDGVTIVTKDSQNDSSATFNQEDWIPSGMSRDFYVTYTYGSNLLNIDEILLHISFNFVIKIESTQQEFMSILNDPDVYDYIAKAFDTKYAEEGSTVIGNVGEDKEIFDVIFGRDLTIEIDGEEKPLTILIERKNVDGKSTGDAYTNHGGNNDLKGCEYTMYLTVDDLSSSGGSATVYAITYTQDNSGNWHKIAQLYEGTCPKVDYDTSTEGYQGAYDVSKWTATAKEYELTDDIHYKVGQANGDQYDIMKDIKSLMSTTDNDIFNELDNTKFFKKVYDIIEANKNSGNPAIMNLYLAFEAASPYYVIYNNGQEIKVKRNCTRAEIIGYITEIVEALDYFNQTTNN